MASAMGVVDSLFDASDRLVWRDQLLHAWKALDTSPTLPMDNLDPAVFTNS